MENINERLKEWRQELGLTQDELALRLGTHVGMIRKYEGGHAVPGGAILAVMAKNGLDMNWLLTGEGFRFRGSPATPVEGHADFCLRIQGEGSRWQQLWESDSYARGVHSFLMVLMRDATELQWLPRSTSVDEYRALVEEAVATVRDISQGVERIATEIFLDLDSFRALLRMAYLRLKARRN